MIHQHFFTWKPVPCLAASNSQFPAPSHECALCRSILQHPPLAFNPSGFTSCKQSISLIQQLSTSFGTFPRDPSVSCYSSTAGQTELQRRGSFLCGICYSFIRFFLQRFAQISLDLFHQQNTVILIDWQVVVSLSSPTKEDEAQTKALCLHRGDDAS